MKNLLFVILFAFFSLTAFAAISTPTDSENVEISQVERFELHSIDFHSDICVIQIVVVDENGEVVAEGDLVFPGVDEYGCEAIVGALKKHFS